MKRLNLLAVMLLMLMSGVWAQNENSRFTSKHFLINNMAEYYAAFAEIQELGESEDGVTIEFDASLKGQMFMAPMNDWKNTGLDGVKVPLKIIGNGVTVDGKDYNFFIKSEKHLFIEDLTLMHTNGLFTPLMDYETNIKNCRFIDCNTILPQAITVDPYSPIIRFENCMILGTEGKDGMQAAFGNIQYFSSSAKIEFISCTFADSDCSKNSIPGFSIFSMCECKFVNCIFDNNKFGGGCPDVMSLSNPYLGEYNVINGSVSGITPGETNFVGECDPVVTVEDGIAYPLASGKAYANIPAGVVEYVDGHPTISGVKLPETDYFGTPIDYTKPVQCGAVQQVIGEPQREGYTDGTFILNEDWYGHQNSTINFLTSEGEMIYRIIQCENEGVQLGCTAQYGTIYGGKMYITSKQEKDPGANVVGGRLTIADARTMKVEKQFQTISAAGFSGRADGRAFVGVNEHKGYMGTSCGIFILDLDTQEFTGYISTGDTEDLYSGQVGNMVRAGDYVFANHQDKGLLVIDAETDEILQAITGPEGAMINTLTLANDGNVWLQSGGKLVKLDPNTLETEYIDLPEGVSMTTEGWGAWRASTFCGSHQQNALYWATGAGFWGDICGKVHKYDIDKNEFSIYIDFAEKGEDWQIYGSGFRIDPVTDEAVMCLFKQYQNPTYITRKYNAQGEKILEVEMEKNYWFPALPIYPDNAAPVVTPLETQQVTLGETIEVSLAGLAEDDDNMTAAIVKTVKAVSDPEVLSASIKGGKLLLEGLAEGTATVTIQVNSNGQLADTEVSVEVTAPVSTVATFENLELAPESYWAGDEDGGYYGLGYTQRFKSGGYTFVNNCIPDYKTWCGYAYSNLTSTEFNSLDDQFKSCVGSGNNGSATYVVAYPDGTMWGEDLTIEVEGGARVVPGFYITNAAYTLSSITDGDSFAGDPFGVGDYFKVTIHALDADGEEISSRDYCLADYRFEREADRYYVNEWEYVDLSQMGEAAAFMFTFSGSRSNSYGLTTPTYFCIDDFGAEGTEIEREEGTTSAINNVIIDTLPSGIYNIYGQRLNKANRPGIYIINGKKIMVK